MLETDTQKSITTKSGPVLPGTRRIETPEQTSSPQPTRAEACGKAIIVGEHAVVYGATAVAMPVQSMHIHVQLSPVRNSRGQVVFAESGERPTVRLMLGRKRASEHLTAVVEDAFALLGIRPFSVDIEGHSSVLMGGGLGSSAALCVVTLRALAASVGIKLGAGDLALLANQLEARFHGKPSGLDTAVVAHERLIAFRRGTPPVAFAAASPNGTTGDGAGWSFALIDSGMRAPTIAMIKLAAPFFAGSAGDARVKRFDTHATTSMRALASGRIDDLAGAMSEAQTLLSEAGVATAPLVEISDESVRCGALAAKITGAGGGGCVLALLHPDRVGETLASLEAQFGKSKVHAIHLGTSASSRGPA